MLRLILGKSGTGKSRWCLDKAAELAKGGGRSVIVVPEQAVYTFERETVSRLEGTLAGQVQVKSFKRLSGDILSECGGCASVRLDAAQKAVLVRRAVLECAGGLTYYRRRAKDMSFYQMLCSLFDELRNAGADAAKLRQVADACGEGNTALKFREIAMILEGYEKLLGSGFFDDAGELEFAASKAGAAEELRGASVFFDGFTGFTLAEYSLLRELMKTAGEVYVTLCCSDPSEEETSAAGVCCRTYDRLKGMSPSEPVVISLNEQRRMKAEGIEEAGEWFGFGVKGSGSTEGVRIIRAADLYGEAEAVADEIFRLTRNEGYRYSQINVTVRDTDHYRHPICRTFERFGIPYHFDVSDTLECSPVTVFLDAAVELAGGMRTGVLLRLLKSGVCGVTAEEISLLENYCFVHSVDRRGWYDPFDLNPSGFGQMRDEEKKQLEETEQARKKVMAWAGDYASGSGNLRGALLLKKAYGLMEACGAADRVAEQNAPGRRNASLAFAMVDRLYRLLQDSDADREELRSMLKLLAGSTRTAEIPAVLDCVMVYDAARSIPFNPRAMFVMGLNDGVFPKDDFSGLLLTLEERDLLLNDHHIRLAGCFDECADLERFYLYRAVTAPSERLYLGWADSDGSGALVPSAELEHYVSLFSPEEAEKDGCRHVVNIATAKDAFAAAGSAADMQFRNAALLSSAGPRLEELSERMKDRKFVLEDRGNAEALTGERMHLSPSRIEAFEKCRFDYFMHYMLNIDPVKKAEMSPIEAGNFIHAVIELLLVRCGMDLTALSDGEIKDAVEEISEEYVKELLEDSQRTGRMMSLTRQLQGGAYRLALRLKEEQAQSGFKVSACELEIGGRTPDIPAHEFDLGNGTKVLLEGKIDRVDTFETADRCYVRVVDYKTGEKRFKLNEALQGVNIQMLLYLFALCREGKEKYGKDKELRPAGVLYMPADPNPETERKSAGKAFTMNGLLLDDPATLEAMEKAGSGVFISETKNKDGSWRKTKTRLSADLFDKLQERMDDMIIDMAVSLKKGEIEARPAAWGSDGILCGSCDYRAVCRRDRLTEVRELREDAADEFREVRSDG